MMDSRTVQNVISRINSLPPLPIAVQKLCLLADDPNADIREVSRVISSDPALTTRVLRVANSAFYGLSHRVGTISQAIMILGFQGVKNLALGISVMEYLNRTCNTSPLKSEDFWRHSLAVACAARLISVNLRMPSPEEAYTIGLLHDMGRVIFLEYFTKPYLEILKKAETGTKPLHILERETFGIDHTKLGNELCKHWKLPQTFARVISDHHIPLIRKSNVTHEDKLINVVLVADNMAKVAHIGASGDPHVEMDFFQYLSPQLLPPESVIQTLLSLPEEVQKAEIFLELANSTVLLKEKHCYQPSAFAVSLKNKAEKDFVSLILLSLGFTVIDCAELSSHEGQIAGVITDEAPTRALAEYCYQTNTPMLDFTKWRMSNPVSSNAIHIESLQTWLTQSLSISLKEGSR